MSLYKKKWYCLSYGWEGGMVTLLRDHAWREGTQLAAASHP
jgi:hypothetical protein